MVLYGQDDGVLGGDEGVVVDRLDDVEKLDLGGEGVAVVDEGHAVRTVPTVQLDRPGQ